MFLKPWEPLSGDWAKCVEDELTRELALHHPLHGRKASAVAKTGASDDVLYWLDDSTFAPVHVTFTKKPPELHGWLGHRCLRRLPIG